MDGAQLSASAINRLGERLRVGSTIDEPDIGALQDLRRQYDSALQLARDRVVTALPDVRPTTRLKTVRTLVDKLRRQATMNLSQVQDIAGMRIVGDMTLAEQDELVARLLAVFPDTKVYDRRASPSFGYRAVHIVPKIEGRLVEIQVRTSLQDRWAQIVERMADHWGRNIRYGERPDEPDSEVSGRTRSEIVDLTRRLSPLIAQCEAGGATRALRIKVSKDAFCAGVTQLLATLGRLDIAGKET